ncbi:MAG: sulfite exporter TauE/SafE family protein [bacterium]|nr:sulfite exporter TauE/SafE family protein [bacterium]
MGITLGWGPCLSFCSPILVSYIAGTQRGWLSGLWNILVFSFVRVSAYIILAGIAASIGQLVVRNYYESAFGRLLYPIVGIVIVILGILIILNKSPNFQFCSKFIKNTLQNNLKGVIILGLLIGFSPCIPLFGVLTYIAFEAKTLLQAIFYGSCFGAGTILTPLIPIGILAGGIPSIILRKPKVLDIFIRICGAILVYFGIKLIIR